MPVNDLPATSVEAEDHRGAKNLRPPLGLPRVQHVGALNRLEGAQHVDKIIEIDQSPIGRTPRSNPATYTGLFGYIRELFAGVPEARVRGYRSKTKMITIAYHTAGQIPLPTVTIPKPA